MRRTSLFLGFALICSLGTARGEEPAGGKPAAGAKKIDWEKASFAERKKYMKSTVLPEMKKLFIAFDAKKYKDMSCQTCHGEKGPETKFKMPNAALPKLPTQPAGFMALQKEKPEYMKFMGTQVKPTMATLLGMPEWTPNNPTGFGCYQCHTKEEAPKAGAAPAGGAGW